MTNTAKSTWNWNIAEAAASSTWNWNIADAAASSTWNWNIADAAASLHLELDLISPAGPHALRATRHPPQLRALGAHLERTHIMTNTANSTWNWN